MLWTKVWEGPALMKIWPKKERSRRRDRRTFRIAAVPLCLLVSFLYYSCRPSDLATSSSVNAEKSTTILMIVAHPDDELLFGGDFLAQHGSSTHVVVTSGRNPNPASGVTHVRRREFFAVARLLEFHGEYLLGWDYFSDRGLSAAVTRRLRDLVCLDKWREIVTHGPEGEYGHPMHHAVHDAVTRALQQCPHHNSAASDAAGEPTADKLFVFQPRPPPPAQDGSATSGTHTKPWSVAKKNAMRLYASQEHVLFQSFAGWQEYIVPVADYDYKSASGICRAKNVRAKGINYCRLHTLLHYS